MLPLQERYLKTLRATQWLAPEELLKNQRRMIEGISRHAYENVPFYRDRLMPLFRHGTCDLRAWREIPILTRLDVAAQGDAMRAISVPLKNAREAEGRTSGTMGPSLHFVQSEVANHISQCLYERTFEAHEIDRTAHQARIRLETEGSAEYPEGREDTGWNLICPSARYSRLSIQESIADQADWLARRAPKYLATYPSTAGGLARHVETSGTTLRLGGVLTVGESIDAITREDIKRVFGCNIIDSYGATEIGYIAFQCPTGDWYHVCAEFVLIELLDEDGNDVIEGKPGRVVITSFHNYAMPFIRYDIGDFAVAAHGVCPCGRSLPRLTRIIGRARNIFSFPDGSQYSPWKWRAVFQPHVKAKQIQLVQTATDCIEIRYVPLDTAALPDAVMIEKIGRSVIHPMVCCRAVAVTEIPRLPSGKMEDCISLVVPTARHAG